jgi:orotate phosphoribosyltransferase
MDRSIPERNLRDLLTRTGAVVGEGHYRYQSGRHGEVYVGREQILSQVLLLSRLCYAIARRFLPERPQVVAGAPVAGALMAQWVAHFSEPTPLAIYTEEGQGGREFPAAFARLVAGRSVLVVDDAVGNGSPAHRVIAAVEDRGGRVIGVGALWNPGEVSFGVYPLYDLINRLYPTYLPAECPLCRQGTPLDSDGAHLGSA